MVRMALWIFNEILKKSFYFVYCILIEKMTHFNFSVCRTCANTYYCKLKLLQSVICKNGPLKMMHHHFRYFRLSNFNMTFVKKFMKKLPILITNFRTYFGVPLCHKILGSGKIWQWNGSPVSKRKSILLASEKDISRHTS